MGIEVREATSDEMKKNIRTVKKMTNGIRTSYCHATVSYDS